MTGGVACRRRCASKAGHLPILLRRAVFAASLPCLQGDVKKRIESLIDREYLQRVEHGYEYLASV